MIFQVRKHDKQKCEYEVQVLFKVQRIEEFACRVG